MEVSNSSIPRGIHPVDVQVSQTSSVTLMPSSYLRRVQLALDAQPAPWWSSPVSADDHRQRHQGLPRQFLLMWLNIRCSYLVPLRGPWRQVRDVDLQPRPLDSCCSDLFHRRFLLPLLPPPSHVT